MAFNRIEIDSDSSRNGHLASSGLPTNFPPLQTHLHAGVGKAPKLLFHTASAQPAQPTGSKTCAKKNQFLCWNPRGNCPPAFGDSWLCNSGFNLSREKPTYECLRPDLRPNILPLPSPPRSRAGPQNFQGHCAERTRLRSVRPKMSSRLGATEANLEANLWILQIGDPCWSSRPFS